jgi:hypothetical protein
MNETTVTRHIRDWFEARGGVCHKNHGGPMSSGFPDLTCCIGGHVWIIEVKDLGAKPRESRALRDKYCGDVRRWLDQGATLRQALALKEWKKAGATALVAKSVKDIEEVNNNEETI